MNERTVSVILVIAASVGCAEPPPDEATIQRELQVAPIAGDDDRAAANQLEREMKAQWAGSAPRGPVAEPVDWDEASRFKQLDPARLPTEQRKKLAEVKLPVLAFDDDALLATALLTHHHNWYVIAVKSDDGLHMNVLGNRNAWTVPAMEIPEAARAAAEDYTLSRTHGIVTVSWRSFGTSYSVDVECAKPMSDPRCTEDEFALAVVEQLGVIGGTP